MLKSFNTIIVTEIQNKDIYSSRTHKMKNEEKEKESFWKWKDDELEYPNEIRGYGKESNLRGKDPQKSIRLKN